MNIVNLSSLSEGVINAIIAVAGVVASALIAGATTLVVQGFQFKRDGSIIKDIHEKTTEKIIPTINNIKETLTDDIKSRKERAEQFPQGASGRDMINSGVSAMFKQYDSINKLYLEAKDQIRELETENANLSCQCDSLSMENAELRGQIRQLEKMLRHAHRQSVTPDCNLERDDREPEI